MPTHCSSTSFQSTPLMRGETPRRACTCPSPPFQSTPLMRGETFPILQINRARDISIHSPHARGDECPPDGKFYMCHFNPLPSCEGRRRSVSGRAQQPYFNPLPSCEGRRGPSKNGLSSNKNFNPLPSCEGRRAKPSPRASTRNFNPLPSCEGRHRAVSQDGRDATFQSTPLMRGETK